MVKLSGHSNWANKCLNYRALLWFSFLGTQLFCYFVILVHPQLRESCVAITNPLPESPKKLWTEMKACLRKDAHKLDWVTPVLSGKYSGKAKLEACRRLPQAYQNKVKTLTDFNTWNMTWNVWRWYMYTFGLNCISSYPFLMFWLSNKVLHLNSINKFGQYYLPNFIMQFQNCILEIYSFTIKYLTQIGVHSFF